MIYIWEITKTILIPILTAAITVKLSLNKFRTEKWWEKKTETYSGIVDALHKLKNYCEQKLEAEYRPNSLSKEKEKELQNQYNQAYQEVTKAIDVGSFIISKEALKVLQDYENRPQLNWNENPLWDIIEHDLDYTKTCLKNFKKEAKKDLGI